MGSGLGRMNSDTTFVSTMTAAGDSIQGEWLSHRLPRR